MQGCFWRSVCPSISMVGTIFDLFFLLVLGVTRPSIDLYFLLVLGVTRPSNSRHTRPPSAMASAASQSLQHEAVY